MKRTYEDIINLPHPNSKRHLRMSALDRGAQFAPFAALTGYDEAVKESARLTERHIELDEGEKQEFDRRLRFISENLELKLPVSITYFVPDSKKSGGSYRTVTGTVNKIDTFKRMVFMGDVLIPIDEIYDIETAISDIYQ